MQKPDYTSKIISRLPYWFAMKKQPSESIGKAFLHAMGMELNEMSYTLDYMYEQISIEKADVETMSECYKVMLPEQTIYPITSVTVGTKVLYEVKDIKDFYNFRNNLERYERLKKEDIYFVDQKRNIIYLQNNYELVALKDSKEKTVQLAPKLHKVWNYFDEFGLLVNVARNPKENNLSYKERIKDVFKNPSSSSYQGLVNGLGRELGFRVELVVDDSSKDVVLPEAMIAETHLFSEGAPIEKNRLVKNNHGQYVLKGDQDNRKKNISYVHSIEVHQFNEYLGQEDVDFENELFYSDGTAKEKLKEYAKLINELCPIMWNHARWDESHWIQDMNSFGYVPNITDGSIKGFAKESFYRPIIDNFKVGELKVE